MKIKPWKLNPGRFQKSPSPEEMDQRKNELTAWANDFGNEFINSFKAMVGHGVVLSLDRGIPWHADFNALGRLVKWYGTLEGTQHDKFMFELNPDRPRPGPNERWTKTLYANVKTHLPDMTHSSRRARETGCGWIAMHQESWAAGLHQDEYTLLGIAAWYSVLQDTPLMIVGSCWSLEPGTPSQQIAAVKTEADRSGMKYANRGRSE